MKFCKTFTKSEKAKIKPVSHVKGMIHSFETFGALDGPGLRFVIFFEGCPLRCVYCHNRDMLDLKDYMSMSASELLNIVKNYKPYFGKDGGVTISGGDPVFQPRFLKEFLKLCKGEGIHTTLDTSLFTTRKVIDSILPYTDIFMISLKHFDSATHKCLTGVPNERILENIRYLNGCHARREEARSGKISMGNMPDLPEGGNRTEESPRIWFRYLILPGYTDTRENLKALIQFLREIKFERIELLPYHTYGIYKWKKLGLKYALEGVRPPSPRSVNIIKQHLEKEGFKVLLNE